jgi:hypothetical protein
MSDLAVATLAVYSKVWAGDPPATPVKVTVKVVVGSAGGGKLSYQWKSTDGTITQVNAPTTTWTLPDGPRLGCPTVALQLPHSIRLHAALPEIECALDAKYTNRGDDRRSGGRDLAKAANFVARNNVATSAVKLSRDCPPH